MELKSWEDMNVGELKDVYSKIENEEFETEWQYEFKKLELIEISKLIKLKGGLNDEFGNS